MRWITLALLATTASAADHAEAPNAATDTPADLADLFAWHQDGELVLAMTFGWLPVGYVAYDRDVLYTFHLDTDGDNAPDHEIHVRFGQDADGLWGVEVSGIPGEDAPIVAPIETTVTSEAGSRVFVGGRDDPFFFDLSGFSDTVTTGTLSFDNTRDGLAGSNVAAIVLSMDAAAATGADGTVAVWATTSRFLGAR